MRVKFIKSDGRKSLLFDMLVNFYHLTDINVSRDGAKYILSLFPLQFLTFRSILWRRRGKENNIIGHGPWKDRLT